VELTTLSDVRRPALPDPAEVMTVLVELSPGDPGSPPAELAARADATRAGAS
jgi:hypothetical protein